MSKGRNALIGLCLAMAPGLAAWADESEWVLRADYVDACSCDMTCPCLFGGSATQGYCKGASLVEIKEGMYRDIDLAGVTVLAVYNGGVWIKFLVSENATKAQTEAVVELLPIAEGFFEAPVLLVRNQPISVVRTDDKLKITTEGTLVELEPIRNPYGEPIKVLGLPAEGFPGLPYLDHTQYQTVALVHESENENYSFSGTNGYTAVIDATSSAPRPMKLSGRGTGVGMMSPVDAGGSDALCGSAAVQNGPSLDSIFRAVSVSFPDAGRSP